MLCLPGGESDHDEPDQHEYDGAVSLEGTPILFIRRDGSNGIGPRAKPNLIDGPAWLG